MSDAPDPTPEESRPIRAGQGPNQNVFQITDRKGKLEKQMVATQLDPDVSWEQQAAQRDNSQLRNGTKVILSTLLLVAIIAAAVITWRLNRQGEAQPPPGEISRSDTYSPAAIRALAQAFADETDPQKRLAMVRNPEEVATHLDDYSQAALSGACDSLRLLGSRQNVDLNRTAFVARMKDGGNRLLVVVETDEGLRVDWDAFARHGSASWPAVLAGDAKSADVRVFFSADDYYNTPFADDSRWRAFSLRSPDVEQPLHAYAEIGSLRERYLSAVAARAPSSGLRTVVRITRKGGTPDRHLFEIERLLAIGWVVSEVDVERQLEETGEEMLARLKAAASPPPPDDSPEPEAGDSN